MCLDPTTSLELDVIGRCRHKMEEKIKGGFCYADELRELEHGAPQPGILMSFVWVARIRISMTDNGLFNRKPHELTFSYLDYSAIDWRNKGIGIGELLTINAGTALLNHAFPLASRGD